MATARGLRGRDLERARVIDDVVAEARSVAAVFGAGAGPAEILESIRRITVRAGA